jgi:nucleoside-triphosphatase THEP1
MDVDDNLIVQFVASNAALPPTTATAAAALAGSIGPTARAYASDRLFGALSGKSRESIIERIQKLIRARKLKCDHVGLSVVDAAAPGVISSSTAIGRAAHIQAAAHGTTPSSTHAFAGVKRTAAAAGLSRPGVAPVARLSSANSIPNPAPSRSFTAEAHSEIDEFEDVELSSEQQAVYDMVVRDGKSVFFTGSAGCGKSFLMRRIIAGLKKKYAEAGMMDAVYVTAPTGIAACNVGGTTIHSFAGIGTSHTPFEELVTSVERKSTTAAKRWRTCRTLVVDEISMLDGATFDLLEQLACRIRKSNKAFGGIQLVLAGDFCQLPPVGLSNSKSGSAGKAGMHSAAPAPAPITFCFEANCWKRVVYAQVQLSQVFRQKDADFVNILNELRVGVLTPKSVSVLAKAGSEVGNLETVCSFGSFCTALCEHVYIFDG